MVRRPAGRFTVRGASMRSWILLFVAGLLETGWAIGLKYTEGFTRPLASILTGLAIVGSMALLGIAAKELPIGTAYPVWVGIGALGAAALGMLLFKEPATPSRIFFLVLLVVSVAGLKATTPAQPVPTVQR
jgi:quaternary ammonium compound-resistance protein SugE